MSDVVQVNVKGLTEINARIKELGPAGKKAARRALFRGTKLIRDEAEARAPIGKSERNTRSFGLQKLKSAHLKRNITASVKETTTGFVGVVRVRAKIFWDRWVEFGTQPHRLGKGSKTRGKKESWIYRGVRHVRGERQRGGQHPGAPAQPYLGPSFQGNSERALELIKKELQDELFK